MQIGTLEVKLKLDTKPFKESIDRAQGAILCLQNTEAIRELQILIMNMQMPRL